MKGWLSPTWNHTQVPGVVTTLSSSTEEGEHLAAEESRGLSQWEQKDNYESVFRRIQRRFEYGKVWVGRRLAEKKKSGSDNKAENQENKEVIVIEKEKP